jgi:hypothetical protein
MIMYVNDDHDFEHLEEVDYKAASAARALIRETYWLLTSN